MHPVVTSSMKDILLTAKNNFKHGMRWLYFTYSLNDSNTTETNFFMASIKLFHKGSISWLSLVEVNSVLHGEIILVHADPARIVA